MSSSKSSGPIRRARQSDIHLALKERVGEALEERGFEVLYEHNLVDIVGFHLEKGWVVAVEVELTVRNLAANLTRNLRTGFSRILIVTPGEREIAGYTRKTREQTADPDLARVVSPGQVDETLEAWFPAGNQPHEK